MKLRDDRSSFACMAWTILTQSDSTMIGSRAHCAANLKPSRQARASACAASWQSKITRQAERRRALSLLPIIIYQSIPTNHQIRRSAPRICWLRRATCVARRRRKTWEVGIKYVCSVTAIMEFTVIKIVNTVTSKPLITLEMFSSDIAFAIYSLCSKL